MSRGHSAGRRAPDALNSLAGTSLDPVCKSVAYEAQAMITGLITARILECQSEEVFSLKEGFLADKRSSAPGVQSDRD